MFNAGPNIFVSHAPEPGEIVVHTYDDERLSIGYVINRGHKPPDGPDGPLSNDALSARLSQRYSNT